MQTPTYRLNLKNLLLKMYLTPWMEVFLINSSHVGTLSIFTISLLSCFSCLFYSFHICNLLLMQKIHLLYCLLHWPDEVPCCDLKCYSTLNCFQNVTKCLSKIGKIAGAGPGFPRGADHPGVPTFENFQKNLHGIEKLLGLRGCAPGTPPRSTTG